MRRGAGAPPGGQSAAGTYRQVLGAAPAMADRQTRLPTRLLAEVWFAAHACQCLVASLFASLFAGKREVPPRAAQGGRRAQGYALPARPGCFLQPPFGKKARRTWALRATGASPRQAAQATFAAASPFLEPGPQNGPAHAARRGANLSVSFSRRRNAHFSPPPAPSYLSSKVRWTARESLQKKVIGRF